MGLGTICECECVCVRERNRERERESGEERREGGSPVEEQEGSGDRPSLYLFKVPAVMHTPGRLGED